MERICLMKFRNAAVIASILVLSACGDGKATKADGSSSQTLGQSLREMHQGLDDKAYLQFDWDLQYIAKQYKDKTEYAKVLDGKNIAQIHELGNAARTDYLHKLRMLRYEKAKQELDRQQAKMDDALAADPDNKYPNLRTPLERQLNHAKEEYDRAKNLSDEDYIKYYEINL